MPEELTAEHFVERLTALSPPGDSPGMGQIFGLAKEFVDMPPDQIERLLDSRDHETRVGALSIMDKQARRKRTPESRRQELFELYLRRPDAIDDWDLVDLGAPHVIGGYLYGKPRDVLYKLARSASTWERRTAIVSTLYFVRQGEVADIFKLAEILLHDDEHLVQTAVGGLLREAGKKDRPQLLSFLDQHAASMDRTCLRFAIEQFDAEQRAHYRGLKRV